MKKVVVGLVSLIIGFASIGSAVADEPAVAKLHMKITSKINDKMKASIDRSQQSQLRHCDEHDEYGDVHPKITRFLPSDH
jgi:hypothetical protein